MPDNLKVSTKCTPIHYSLMRCTGEQESLLDCQLSEITTGCSHDRDAAIVCRHSEEGVCMKWIFSYLLCLHFCVFYYVCVYNSLTTTVTSYMIHRRDKHDIML